MSSPTPIRRRADIIVSTVGGFIGIALVMWISERFVGSDSLFVVASIGSSAVIVFSAPEAPVARPRAVLVSHLAGAFFGVSAATFAGHGPLAGALAVSATIAVMLAVDALHPPAGATALTAVVGGTAVTDLGYRFVLTPVALNVVILIVLAGLAATIVPWRSGPQLPASLVARTRRGTSNLTSDHDDDGLRAGS